MSDEIRSVLPSAVFLGAAGLWALHLTLTRSLVDPCGARISGAIRTSLVATLLQAGHFGEELATGLSTRLPALFGLPPMPPPLFLWFNIGWLVAWCLSLLGLAAHKRAALFPLWFLGIASVGNGVAHPALSLAARGYFPGLLTSPLVGTLGVLLLRRLGAVTRATASP